MSRSVRLETMPRFTKNFAGGTDDTTPCAGVPEVTVETPVTDRRIVPQPHSRAQAKPAQFPRQPGALSPGRYHRAMLLALDIGNTNITLGLVQGEAIIAARRATTKPASTPDEVEVLIDGLLHLDGASMSDVTGISMASVVPALTEIGRAHV